MAVSESNQKAWRHKFYKNQPDVTAVLDGSSISRSGSSCTTTAAANTAVNRVNFAMNNNNNEQQVSGGIPVASGGKMSCDHLQQNGAIDDPLKTVAAASDGNPVSSLDDDQPLDFSIKKSSAAWDDTGMMSATNGHAADHENLPKNEPIDWSQRCAAVNKDIPQGHQMLRSYLQRDSSSHHRSAFETVGSGSINGLGSTVAATSAILPSPASLSTVSPFLASLLKGSLESAAIAGINPDRNLRPFKAYNPMDPSTAFQVGCLPMFAAAAAANNPSYDLSALISRHKDAQQSVIRSNSGASLPILNRGVIRPHSVPSQSGSATSGTTTSPHEVTSSTTNQPQTVKQETTGRVNANNVRQRESSNSPTSTSDLSISGRRGLKREHSPTRSAEPSPHRRSSDSGASSDGIPTVGTGANSLATPTSSEPESITEASLGLSTHASTTTAEISRPRRRGISLPEELKDDTYWERRRKNNEAAKRSRDTRRAKEDEIAMRAAWLEQENMKLRIEAAALRAETDKLRHMLLNS